MSLFESCSEFGIGTIDASLQSEITPAMTDSWYQVLVSNSTFHSSRGFIAKSGCTEIVFGLIARAVSLTSEILDLSGYEKIKTLHGILKIAVANQQEHGFQEPLEPDAPGYLIMPFAIYDSIIEGVIINPDMTMYHGAFFISESMQIVGVV